MALSISEARVSTIPPLKVGTTGAVAVMLKDQEIVIGVPAVVSVPINNISALSLRYKGIGTASLDIECLSGSKSVPLFIRLMFHTKHLHEVEQWLSLHNLDVLLRDSGLVPSVLQIKFLSKAYTRTIHKWVMPVVDLFVLLSLVYQLIGLLPQFIKDSALFIHQLTVPAFGWMYDALVHPVVSSYPILFKVVLAGLALLFWPIIACAFVYFFFGAIAFRFTFVAIICWTLFGYILRVRALVGRTLSLFAATKRVVQATTKSPHKNVGPTKKTQ